jgi:hypothetical protein
MKSTRFRISSGSRISLPDQFARADHLADRAALLVAVHDPRMFDALVVQAQEVGIV